MIPSILGDILLVDLSSRQIARKTYTRELASQYIGSRGYNAALLWELSTKGMDPFSPQNPLIFGAGPLTGTSAPSSGRISVTTKSPATNLYLKTNVGGAWGGSFRFAGYSFLVITGCAETPVYLWIDDDKVEIRDGRQLWGLDVRQTEHALQNEIGDNRIRLAVIGPAGEKQVMFAAIMCSNYNAAARGGGGAVMGSKNLKAIAIRGSQPVRVAEPERFNELISQSWDLYHAQSGVENLHLYGTSGGVIFLNEINAFPTRNFQGTPVSLPMDMAGVAITMVCVLSERRLNRLTNPALSVGLPPFLTKGAGMFSGMMLSQYTACMMIVEQRILSTPASTQSIPAAADQEDFVSMGMNTALKNSQILDNAYGILGIEFMAAAQALDFREFENGAGVKAAHNVIRKHVDHLDVDRPLFPDHNSMKALVKSGEILEAVEAAIGNLG